MSILKPTELCTLNGSNLWHVNYSLIWKFFFKKFVGYVSIIPSCELQINHLIARMDTLIFVTDDNKMYLRIQIETFLKHQYLFMVYFYLIY